MIWTRKQTLGMAKQRCSYCWGLGLKPARGKDVPCDCVFRAIFRQCFNEFRKCASAAPHVAGTKLARFGTGEGGTRSIAWGMPRQEFAADFVLVAARLLGKDTQLHKIFKFHFLLGADWKLCCGKLNINRGDFFHEVYRIEAALGRAFAELEPYALWPCDEYRAHPVSRARRAYSPGAPSFEAHEPKAVGRTDRVRLRPPVTVTKAAA